MREPTIETTTSEAGTTSPTTEPTAPEPAAAEPTAPEPAAPPKIDFERAELADETSEQVECGLCKRAITTEYWQSVGKILCERCRDVVRGTADGARRGATLGKAFLLGGLVALGCGIGYAVFVGQTHYQFALITIGIGWAVGQSIQSVTRGFGSRKHQILAVMLTYCASSMGYLPSLLSGLGQGASGAGQEAPAEASPGSPLPPPEPPTEDSAGAPWTPPPAPAEAPVAQPGSETPAEEPSALAFVLFTVFAGLLMLAAPFLDITSGFSGVLGLLIMFFGMRTAWRVARGVEATVSGPYKVASAAAES